MLVEVYALEDDCCRLKLTLSALVPVGHGPSATVFVNDCGSVWRGCAGKSRCTARITANHRFAKIKSDAAQRGKGSGVRERRALTLKAGQGMADREIRTLDSLAGMPVFKTGDINYLAISPTILSLHGFARRFPITESRKMGWPAFFALLPLCFKSAPSYAHTR